MKELAATLLPSYRACIMEHPIRTIEGRKIGERANLKEDRFAKLWRGLCSGDTR